MPTGATETQQGSGSEIRARYRFKVFLRENNEDIFVAGFTTITGLEKEVNVVDWRVGDENKTKKLPGFTNYPAIVMERGQDAGRTMEEWFDLVQNTAEGTGAAEYRKGLVIQFLNRDGTVFKQVFAPDAWPSKYMAGELDANSEDPLVEQVEVQHNGWFYEDVGANPSTDSNTSG